MSAQKKWFKSAFSQEFSSAAPPSKKSRILPRSSSFPNSFAAKVTTTSVCDLTLSDDENADITVAINKQSPKVDFASSNWIENFAPNSLTELAIHPKKVQEVKDWLQHCEALKKKAPGQILLITGPSGSGKTATTRVVAKEMEYEVVEWVTPIDVELVSYNNNGRTDDIAFVESQVEVFRRFLFRSSRYKSVFESLEKRLVIVEDFPNCFVRNSEGFTETLEDYRKYGKSPLIFIVTDSRSRSLNIAYNLFPDNVQNTLSIVHISFNPVSTTLMKKALKRICDLMSQDGFNQFYKPPNADDVESINLASQGDIRNAVINLHFASQKGASRLQSELCSTSATTTKNKRKAKKLKTIGRDESITMMHALGRVFNPKYVDDKEKPKNLLHKPEVITDAFISQPKNFVDFIYSNYLPHFGEIGHVLGAIDSISRSDIMLSEYREDALAPIGLNIAVRGVMAYNEKPVTGWMPVRGIKKQNRDYNIQEELKILGINWHLSKAILASDYRTYAKIIRAQN